MISVLFSPGLGPRNEIITRINAAIESIDIALYCFTDQIIWAALQAAITRGIPVRLLLDKRELYLATAIYTTFIRYNPQPNLQCNKSLVKGTMHCHYAIIDSRILLTGSYNWTYLAASVNCENLITTDDLHTLGRYISHYNIFWADSIALP